MNINSYHLHHHSLPKLIMKFDQLTITQVGFILELEDTLFLNILNRLVDELTLSASIKNDILNILYSEIDNQQQADRIYQAIYTMHVLCISTRTSPNDLIETICQELNTTRSEDRLKITTRILNILSIQQIKLSIKAIDLLNDNNLLYIDGKIITDIRPVFEDDPTLPIVGAMIVHTLKMNLRDQSKNRSSMYIAVDSKALRSLREVIDRALKKAETISQQYHISSPKNI